MTPPNEPSPPSPTGSVPVGSSGPGQTPLTPTRLREIRTLFDAVVECGPETRADFLLAAAPDDPALRDEVTSLLAALDSGDDPLERSPARLMAQALSDDGSALVGARVGPYELVRRIGVGGMGAVYEGVRADDQFRMRVAIKLLRPSTESDLAIRRFRYERQILANLDHQNIAALLDGGVTTDGHPYLVMEYVEGAPITSWCDARRLSPRERVTLFRQVCDAVRHAHQNLVVHRDLKPGNILVAQDGTVKLLDFGIAKLLREEEGPDQLPATHGGVRACTPEYASPEQIRGLPVGTTSDVYALGVVLFELLTGNRPLDLEGRLLAEVERIVCEELPPRPSTVVTDDAAEVRGERSAARLRARLSGDLDAIVLTALRKEPERRYGSAEQLALDLGRYLDGLPVTARRDSVGYRFGKFARRRRFEIAAAAVVILSLVGGVVSTMRQAQQVEVARARTTAINDFLLTMLGAADPGSLGRDVTVREVLDSAAVHADSLALQPRLEADVRSVIGRTYLGLGEYGSAREQLRRVLEVRRGMAPEGDRDVALALNNLALAVQYDGEFAAADSMHQDALALFTRTAARDDTLRASLLNDAAQSRHELGDLVAAERLYREAIGLRERFIGPDDPGLVAPLNNLGVVLGDLGQIAAAESLHAHAVTVARRIYGPSHPIVAMAINNHANVLELAGRLAESDSLFRVTIAMRREILGPEHPDYAWTLFNYAQFLIRRERWAEAERYSREVLALRGTTLPDAHPAVATAMQALGLALAHQGKPDEGERWLRESLELRRTTLPEGHWLVSTAESVLGEHLTQVGRFAEAEKLLLPSEARLVAERGAKSPQVSAARERVVKLYEAWQRPDEAAHWRTLLAESQ